MKKIIFFLAFILIVHCTLKIEDCMSQWQPDVRLTNNPANSYTSVNNAWCIAANGSVVHVVWYDFRDGNNEIYYKRSTDAGLSWGADTRLTNNASSSELPSIAVSGNIVHIVWCDTRDENWEIYYKRSTDSGITWGADTRLTNTTYDSRYPCVSVSVSVVHVVWTDDSDGNWEIYYKRSTNGGVTWGADIRLTNNSAESYDPSVAVSGSVVHVVWYDYRDGIKIYYKRSTDGGVSWGADTRLTNNFAESKYPSVAVSGSFVHVVWDDSRDGNYEIYYKCSTDAGASWGADTRLTNNSAISELPSIAVSGTVVHIVWYDTRDGNYEIYYKRTTDGGTNWGADTRLTNFNGASSYPSTSISGSVVHIVWSDSRNGNYEIYYKRNPTGNTIGIKNITSEIPSSYSLEQNYPNPFNPMTKIKFEIPDRSPIGTFGDDNIVLKVFDILGKEVATLVNESLKPGTYETSWNASNYPSGVYFYKLSAGDFSETKKMLMIK